MMSSKLNCGHHSPLCLASFGFSTVNLLLLLGGLLSIKMELNDTQKKTASVERFCVGGSNPPGSYSGTQR